MLDSSDADRNPDETDSAAIFGFQDLEDGKISPPLPLPFPFINHINSLGAEGGSPRKCGHLSKQGGSNKAWRRRWVVFEKGELKYYRSSQVSLLVPLSLLTNLPLEFK